MIKKKKGYNGENVCESIFVAIDPDTHSQTCMFCTLVNMLTFWNDSRGPGPKVGLIFHQNVLCNRF